MAALRKEGPALYLDCTFGGGGHTRGLLESNAEAAVVGLDCDPEAAERATAFCEKRFEFIALNFGKLATLDRGPFDGILMDLGVSSFQLDTAERGFSFNKEAPCDMRMDTRSGVTAAQFLETASEAELTRAIRDFGEEVAWRKVVRSIIETRETHTWDTTTALAAWLADLLPKHTRIHPATKVFQGIRIAINDELGNLERGLLAAFAKLKPGGVLAVISFHSLEDRIVKQFFREKAGLPIDRHDARCQDDRAVQATLLTKKPIIPTSVECAQNPRSRSAKLRILQKSF